MDHHYMNTIEIVVKFVSYELRDNVDIINIDEIKRKLIQDLINNYNELLFGCNIFIHVDKYVEKSKIFIDNVIRVQRSLKDKEERIAIYSNTRINNVSNEISTIENEIKQIEKHRETETSELIKLKSQRNDNNETITAWPANSTCVRNSVTFFYDFVLFAEIFEKVRTQ
ncbi:unnamed protein product, partial [Didymodactylos carnosus]